MHVRYVVKGMANNQPVGVFDSGVGGLSVLKSIHQYLPSESLLYLADKKYVPYGEKETSFIIERCIKIADYFLAQSVKVMVIACNTASAAASTVLRERYPQLPIIAVEPAIKPAVQVTQSKKIGVLATTSTIKSIKFASLIERFAVGVEVYAQPCPGLVDCIEQGDLMGDTIKQLLQSYVQILLDKGCDTIVLGCTHYPFLRPLMSQFLPKNVQVIDTGEPVARYLSDILNKLGANSDKRQASIDLVTTGSLSNFNEVVSHLWLDTATSIQFIDL